MTVAEIAADCVRFLERILVMSLYEAERAAEEWIDFGGEA